MCGAVKSNASADLLKSTKRTLRETLKDRQIIYDDIRNGIIIGNGEGQLLLLETLTDKFLKIVSSNTPVHTFICPSLLM